MENFETLQHRDSEGDGTSEADGSLIVLILDTNPSSWAALKSTTLAQTVADALIFLNAHLALNQANEAAVIASHTSTARFLYPSSSITGTDPESRDLDREANAYRPFLNLQDQVTANLRNLLSNTPPSSSSSSMMSGAMTLGLSYINKLTREKRMTARMTILSLSGDLESQYIPMMNAIFSAQRQHVVMDVLRIGEQEAVFLEQASDATKGIYRSLKDGESVLVSLMMLFLPDPRMRGDLVMPPAQQVDFRAACFCHKRVLDIGFVCSVCLSIFCQALPKCITCDAEFDMQEMKVFGAKPAVLVKKKKQRKPTQQNGAPPLQQEDSIMID